MACGDFKSPLRALALSVDGYPADKLALSALWQRLTRRELEIVDVFGFEGRSYLVLRVRPSAGGTPSDRNLNVLRQVLLGGSRKVISYDLGVGTSTLAQVLKQELLDIGLTCAPSRVPEMLVMLAHAAHGCEPPANSFISSFGHDDAEHIVVGSRLQSALLGRLPPAVRAVIQLHAAGRSYADIAVHRRTSTRTVANQVALAFQRLGVSGRMHLLHRIFSSFEPAAGAMLTELRSALEGETYAQ